MLFNEFVLHNFGVYRGRHVINLEPKANRPIILFGALNGSGKTTFLDGLQLALYGKQARCSGRGNMAYPDFLRRSINRHVPPAEGAALELEFSHHQEGRWQTIRVNRTWSVRGESVRERVEVYRDKVLDSVLSEHWNEYVEDFIPSQISELFFFDGEKIEALAEESSASAIIRTGIHALLGLDVVDRLSADLKVIQRRRRLQDLDQDGQGRVAAKQKEVEGLNAGYEELVSGVAAQKEVECRLRKQVEQAFTRYRASGSELADRAPAIEQRLKELYVEANRQREHLREMAAASVPLLLVKGLLGSAKTQLLKEQEARRAHALLEELEERDHELLVTLKHISASGKVIEAISSKLAQDRDARRQLASHEIYLNLSPKSLDAFNEDAFKQLAAEVRRELRRAKELDEQVQNYESKKRSIPNIEAIEPLRRAYSELNAAHLAEQAKLKYMEQELDRKWRAFERAQQEYRVLMAQEAESALKAEANRRALQHIEKVEETLKRYRQEILARNLQQLGELILDSFQQISRKKSMFSRIEISASDYRLALFDPEGMQVPSYQLSAGERQLLAVSILWGLSRAAGRSLPAIIDTPLGRLDGVHRARLVSSYFPVAVKQVILLSTDQEIDAELYKKLRKSIAREYLIEFNQRERSSEIHVGYFDFEAAA